MTDTHIKMPAVTPRVQYTANGVDTIYQYPFPIFASEDLQIFFDGVRQYSGFLVDGYGQSSGGTVTFDTPPIQDVQVILIRQIPYERYTDFLESGEFSAKGINNELDYLTAALQQLERDQQAMLRFDITDENSTPQIPSKPNRAGKALGFDANGNPIAVDYGLTQAPTSFTAIGTGAVNRQITDKMSDLISIKDYGAIGDGINDDTLAIGKALAAHNVVYIPQGIYRITAPIDILSNKTILGGGVKSIIKADTNLFTALRLRGGYCTLSNFTIDGGDYGLYLEGIDTPCVQNTIDNLVIQNANTGIILDGGDDTNYPCYWNIISRCLILSPLDNGIILTKTGAGDTPNANIFESCRVYSQSTPTTGHGVQVTYGSFYNRFINCEINVDGTAQSCMTIGANANETVIDNLYCESNNGVPNLVLASGSQKTLVTNLLTMSDGAAIDDQSGGAYQAINAGHPVPNQLGRTKINDLTTTLQRMDTVYVDAPSTATLDLDMDISVHLVAATNGDITLNLPLPTNYAGCCYTIKKVDFTGNAVTVSEQNGLGIDRKGEIILGGPYDYVTILSNGAEWFVTSSNRMAGNTKYYDTSGQLDIDMSVDTYLISAYGGVVTCRLPPANATEAIGRTITIKKTDISSNAVYVSEQGGNGPDQYTQPLASQYNAITVTSNGGQWYIVNKF